MTGPSRDVGLIGLGLMGSAMARRLSGRGWQVTGFDIEAAKVADLSRAGVAAAAKAPAAAAEAGEVTLLCVTGTAAVEAAVFGDGGVCQAASPGRVLVDLSTSDAEATRRMAARLEADTGMAWVDAPVSGGSAGAAEGTLAIMAGGAADALERARPVLGDLAASLTHMGPVGAGQATKMINQVIVLSNYAVLAEALKLGENAGVDVARIPECLGEGHAGSNMLRDVFPRMVARQYEPPAAFARQVLKDLDMVYDLAKKTATPTPMADQARQLYRLFVSRGHGERDPISILRLFDDEPV